MPNKVKESLINKSSTIEDESFITIEGESFGVIQTTPPKDLLIKASKLNFIQDDLKNSVARENVLREKNIRILSSLDLNKATDEDIDKLLKNSYEIEEKIEREVERQNKIFNDIFTLAYDLLKWSLGIEVFNKIKDDLDSMGSIELANKAYEAISKNKVLQKYIKNQQIA